MSVDPMSKSYPWFTPYQFASNMPIACTDLDGLEANWVLGGWYALQEYGEQVIDNFADGKRGEDLFFDVDVADIAIEFADGMVNDAIPDYVKEVAKEAINANIYTGEYKIELTVNTFKDAAVEYVGDKIIDKTVGIAKKKARGIGRDVDARYNKADRDNRLAGNGDNLNKNRTGGSKTEKGAAQHNYDHAKKVKTAKNIIVDVIDKTENIISKGNEKSLGVTGALEKSLVGSAKNQILKNPIRDATTTNDPADIRNVGVKYDVKWKRDRLTVNGVPYYKVESVAEGRDEKHIGKYAPYNDYIKITGKEPTKQTESSGTGETKKDG